MASSDRVRVEVGFDGGQVMAAIVSVSSAEELERAVDGGGDGFVALQADDGTYRVALGRVAYVKRFAREGRVGFGG